MDNEIKKPTPPSKTRKLINGNKKEKKENKRISLDVQKLNEIDSMKPNNSNNEVSFGEEEKKKNEGKKIDEKSLKRVNSLTMPKLKPKSEVEEEKEKEKQNEATSSDNNGNGNGEEKNKKLSKKDRLLHRSQKFIHKLKFREDEEIDFKEKEKHLTEEKLPEKEKPESPERKESITNIPEKHKTDKDNLKPETMISPRNNNSPRGSVSVSQSKLPDHLKIVSAVLEGDINSLKFHLSNKKLVKFIDHPDELGENAMLNAAFACRIDMIEDLLMAGADVNWKSKKNGCTALHYLAKHTNKKRLGSINKYKKILRIFTYRKANLLEKDLNDDTPIHCAAMVGNTPALKVFLPFCGDPNPKNLQGDTPLSFAIKSKQIETAQLLVEFGGNPNMKCGSSNETPYELTVKTGQGNIKIFNKIEITESKIDDSVVKPSNDQNLKVISGYVHGQVNSVKLSLLISYYKNFFFNYNHYIYLYNDGKVSNSKVVCVIKTPKDGVHKALLLNTWGFWKLDIDSEEVTEYAGITDDLGEQLKHHLNDLLTSRRYEISLLQKSLHYESLLKLVNSQSMAVTPGTVDFWAEYQLSQKTNITFDILGLEAKLGSVNTFTIGVVLGLAGQKNEEKMFENEKVTEGFSTFLDILGEKQSTLGWENYNGNLSSKEDKIFYYTSWRGLEIAFHVAPYMTEQERRQHIGNDKALIYFVADPFDPAFRGNVNSIAFVVQPKKVKKETHYKVGSFYRKRVNRFIPYLPEKVFKPNELRDILIGNAINGIDATSKSPPYSATVDTLYENELGSLMQKYKKNNN